MTTTAENYNSYLHVIYNSNPPVYAALPSADNIYNIDMTTREINAPQFLAVEKDNISETIYFIVDRYIDYMDLSLTSCIIFYTNALGEVYSYSVPFYDIYTYSHVGKMIIPWNLENSVTEAAGLVQFSISFFMLTEKRNPYTGQIEKDVAYKINTQIATSRILPGMNYDNIKENYKLKLSEYEQVLNKISIMEKNITDSFRPAWIILPD